jgi:hypothetical protein
VSELWFVAHLRGGRIRASAPLRFACCSVGAPLPGTVGGDEQWSRLCGRLPGPVPFVAGGAGRAEQAGGQHVVRAPCFGFTATAPACWPPFSPIGRISSRRSPPRSSQRHSSPRPSSPRHSCWRRGLIRAPHSAPDPRPWMVLPSIKRLLGDPEDIGETFRNPDGAGGRGPDPRGPQPAAGGAAARGLEAWGLPGRGGSLC